MAGEAKKKQVKGFRKGQRQPGVVAHASLSTGEAESEVRSKRPAWTRHSGVFVLLSFVLNVGRQEVEV